jgi:hypothetical protein
MKNPCNRNCRDFLYYRGADYSALSALKKLKVLGICVYRTSTNVTIKVKDLDFISEMPNLEYVDFMDVRLI